MNNVWVFTSNNARNLRVEDADLPPWLERQDAAVNPDLTQVHGLPPHYWKLVGGQVVSLNDPERRARDKHLEQYGADCVIPPHAHQLVFTGPKVDYGPLLWALAVGALLTAYWILKRYL